MKPVTCASSSAIALTGFVAFFPAGSPAQDRRADTIAIEGDIRLRYEAIDEEGDAERNRGRFRARLGLTAEVNDNVEAVVRIASGGDNPTSTNQSFDDGFSRKDIGLDLAYLDWTPNDNTHVYGGKMKNPLRRAGGHALVWDSDLNPEGIAIKYETGGLFGTAGLMFVEERSLSDDSLLMAVQGGYRFDVFDGAKLTAGVGYFSYTNTVGNAPFYDGRARRNSADIDGNLILDYNELEVFAELDTRIGDMPFKVYIDIIQNTDANTEDRGYAIGAAVGKAGDPGTWQGSWTYQDLEADALIATFTDSDFGAGGTDTEGHVLRGKYALADGWALAGSLFLNEVDEFAGNRHDYDRLQIDLEFKF